jgi:hypothetical protein
MEWVSYLAGERHSNEPYRVSPVLRAFCRTLNEAIEDEPHQRLLPYLERTIGHVPLGPRRWAQPAPSPGCRRRQDAAPPSRLRGARPGDLPGPPH